MAIEIGISQILTKLSSEMIRLSLDKFLKSNETRNAILILKESLARELRLAIELLGEVRNENSEDPCESKVFVECIELEGFEAIARSGIPLAKIIQISIDENFWSNLNLDDQQRGFVRNIRSGDDLLERTFLRIKMHKIRLSFNGRQTNIEYLKKLILASLKAIELSK